MTTFAFPYTIGHDGRTASAGIEQHVSDLIELVLFTAPGERVNRPEFGAGLAQRVFSENAPELASAAQHLVQSGLQRWLSDYIELRGVDVSSRGEVLSIHVRFRLLEEAQERSVSLNRKV